MVPPQAYYELGITRYGLEYEMTQSLHHDFNSENVFVNADKVVVQEVEVESLTLAQVKSDRTEEESEVEFALQRFFSIPRIVNCGKIFAVTIGKLDDLFEGYLDCELTTDNCTLTEQLEASFFVVKMIRNMVSNNRECNIIISRTNPNRTKIVLDTSICQSRVPNKISSCLLAAVELAEYYTVRLQSRECAISRRYSFQLSISKLALRYGIKIYSDLTKNGLETFVTVQGKEHCSFSALKGTVKTLLQNLAPPINPEYSSNFLHKLSKLPLLLSIKMNSYQNINPHVGLSDFGSEKLFTECANCLGFNICSLSCRYSQFMTPFRVIIFLFHSLLENYRAVRFDEAFESNLTKSLTGIITHPSYRMLGPCLSLRPSLLLLVHLDSTIARLTAKDRDGMQSSQVADFANNIAEFLADIHTASALELGCETGATATKAGNRVSIASWCSDFTTLPSCIRGLFMSIVHATRCDEEIAELINIEGNLQTLRRRFGDRWMKSFSNGSKHKYKIETVSSVRTNHRLDVEDLTLQEVMLRRTHLR
jgi:hypothetical protein